MPTTARLRLRAWAPTREEDVFELRTTLNARLRDRPLSETPEIIAGLPGHVDPALRGLLTTLTTVLLEALVACAGVTLKSVATAIDLPLKLLVREDAAGEVWVSYWSAQTLLARHGLAQSFAANVAVIEAIARQVTE